MPSENLIACLTQDNTDTPFSLDRPKQKTRDLHVAQQACEFSIVNFCYHSMSKIWMAIFFLTFQWGKIKRHHYFSSCYLAGCIAWYAGLLVLLVKTMFQFLMVVGAVKYLNHKISWLLLILLQNFLTESGILKLLLQIFNRIYTGRVVSFIILI